MRVPVTAFAVVLVFIAGSVSAQVSRCVECHFANLGRAAFAQQLAEWDRSPHAKHGVACDSCHGGDPTTYQPVDAHRGVLNGHHPLSTVARTNLALTCAPCHSGVVAAYKLSVHAARLAGDVSAAPACPTCHGAMAAQTPSPARIEMTCARCHAGEATRADYPALARQRIEALRGIEQTLTAVEGTIASLADRPRRNRLAAELLLARTAFRSATDAVHTFDFRVIDDRRAVAQRRTNELVADLVPSR